MAYYITFTLYTHQTDRSAISAEHCTPLTSQYSCMGVLLELRDPSVSQVTVSTTPPCFLPACSSTCPVTPCWSVCPHWEAISLSILLTNTLVQSKISPHLLDRLDIRGSQKMNINILVALGPCIYFHHHHRTSGAHSWERVEENGCLKEFTFQCTYWVLFKRSVAHGQNCMVQVH